MSKVALSSNHPGRINPAFGKWSTFAGDLAIVLIKRCVIVSRDCRQHELALRIEQDIPRDKVIAQSQASSAMRPQEHGRDGVPVAVPVREDFSHCLSVLPS